MSWRYIYREVAENYQWPPQVISNLTQYQVRMLTCDKKLLGGRQRISPAEAAKYGIK